MCEFISWIEKDDEVLFLTREDIYSKRGRELFKDCLDNDVLGHGAIRQFYGVDIDYGIWELRGGVEKECQDFWELDKYPEKIQKALKDFEENFSHIWEYMDNSDLRYIVRWGTEEYQDLAWEKLLPKVNVYDLCNIIEWGPTKYQKLSWERLLSMATNESFNYIVCYGHSEYKQLAWEQLLPKADYLDLHYIVCYGTTEYMKLAQAELDRRNTNV